MWFLSFVARNAADLLQDYPANDNVTIDKLISTNEICVPHDQTTDYHRFSDFTRLFYC